MHPSRAGLACAYSVDTNIALLRINKQYVIITVIFFTLSVLGLIKGSVLLRQPLCQLAASCSPD